MENNHEKELWVTPVLQELSAAKTASGVPADEEAFVQIGDFTYQYQGPVTS